MLSNDPHTASESKLAMFVWHIKSYKCAENKHCMKG